MPTNTEKNQVWTAYRERRPLRVPLRWNTNPRIILLNPELNPEGYTFEQYTFDPQVLLTIQARWQEYLAGTLSKTCDMASTLPEQWNFYVDPQNTYDGAYFGTGVTFADNQCPSNEPCLGLDDIPSFIKQDFSRPLENPWIQERLAFHAKLTHAAKDFRHLGRQGKVAPFSLGFDGPVTVAAILTGANFFALLGSDPDLAVALMQTLSRAALTRNKALTELHTPWSKGDFGGMADDSIQLISTPMYRRLVLPLHEWWYSATSNTTAATGKRGIHLCGDATRHFPTIHQELGVESFDTGFPVDHGRLRRELGPEVEISGGPEAELLREGTPEQCAARAREILQSGIMEGGRFILQEGNNLPPCCPLANLQAVYETCLEFGCYA